MKMRSLLAVLVVLCLLLSLTACGKPNTPDPVTTTTTGSQADGSDQQTTSTDADASGDEGTGSTKATSGTGKTSASGSGVTKTTSTTKTQTGASVGAGFIGTSIKLRPGTKGAEEGLDFGGKTFTMAGPDSETYRQMLAEFGKEFNCKVEVTRYDNANYTQAVAAAMVAGKPFDILMMNSQTTYPSLVIANCAVPLQKYLTTADIWDGSNPKKGGFLTSSMEGLSWKGNIYGVAGAGLSSPTVMYYNKKVFKDERLTDPYELWEKGKWTWDKFQEYGALLTDPSKDFYMCGNLMQRISFSVPATFDTDYIKVENGYMKENLSDTKLYNALNLLQKMSRGTTQIIHPTASMDAALMNGKTACIIYSSSAWQPLYNQAKESNAFAKDVNNLGVVPMPSVKENSNKYKGIIWSWMGYCAGNGTEEPLAAIALAKFDSTHNLLEIDQKSMPDKVRQMFYNIVGEDDLYAPYWGLKSSFGSVQDVQANIVKQVVSGKNIAQVLSAYKKSLQNIIDDATK